MKVLHVVRQYAPSLGGLEEYVKNLVQQQSRLAVDCLGDAYFSAAVLTLNSNFQTDKRLPKHEIVDGIEVHRIGWKGSKRYSICRPDMAWLNGFDLIHVHAVDFFVDYLSLQKRIGRLKPVLVLTTHGGFFHTPNQQGLKRLFFKTVTPFSLRKFSLVYTISSNDDVLFKQVSSNTRLLPNAVANQKFGNVLPLARKPDLVYLGRFSSNKRLPWLIKQYASLKEPAGQLIIVGSRATGDVTELEILIDQLDCADRVRLVLDAPDETIQTILSRSMSVVSASEYEGFGLSVVELMSYGLVPFLSHHPASFVDFITQSNCGMLFGDADFCQQYDQLMQLNWPVHSHRAHEYSHLFSWSSLAASVLQDYKQLMEVKK